MNKNSVLKNNKGASLVLVIVAMMFVAIIASIVLTLTVGNNKSAKATMDTSENFYSSESILDDLNMYLKKLGTAAATEAYADMLVEESDPALKETYFKNKYAEILGNVIQTQVLDVYAIAPTGTETKYALNTDFIRSQIAFAEFNDLIKNGIISIKYDSFDTDSYPAVLRGVEISYIDENGFENIIKTDIVFKANLPKTGEMGSYTSFSYPIDHFVMISGRSINPGNNLLAQTIKGSVYALENINIKTKTDSDSGVTDSDWVKFYSQYVIAGKNINVNGRLSVAPIHLANNYDASAEVWCDNIYLIKKDAEVKTGDSEETLDTDVYLAGNLELNGSEAKYTGVKGDFYGISKSDVAYYNPTTPDAEKPKSSAIILNGLGAKLNLSGLSSLNIAGTAYSALPDPTGTGTVDMYNYYIGTASDEPAKVYYYSQGDSVTVRSLQALYLIPGDFIPGVGHNPMKNSEFEGINKGANIDTSSALVDGLLNSGKIKTHYVKYLNGEQYVYIFWDFKDIDSAITYFNRVTSTDARYAGLFEKQMSALGAANGEIKLPTTVNTTGYAVKYDSSATPKFGKAGKVATSLGSYYTKYSGLLTTLDKDNPEGTDIISTMFGDFTGEHSKYAKEEFGLDASTKDKRLSGPYTPYETPDGTRYTYTTSDTKHYYKLITGDNVTLNSAPMVKDESGSPVQATTIIITPGDVNLNYSGTFRGLIIAGGNIKIDSNLNMECLGNVKRTQKITDADGHESEPEEQELSEFQALLGIAPNDLDLSNPNSRLREIFGVRDSSYEVGDGDGSNLVVNELVGWSRN